MAKAEDGVNKDTPVMDVIDKYSDTLNKESKRGLEVIDELEVDDF